MERETEFVDSYNSIIKIDLTNREQHSSISNENRLKLQNAEAHHWHTFKLLFVILTLIAIMSGWFSGRTIFAHEVEGLNTVCYTTRTGDCYHAAGCRYLSQSAYSNNVYDARRHGLKDCSVCRLPKLDISTKYEYVYGILICLALFLPWPLIILHMRYHRARIALENAEKHQCEKADCIWQESIMSIIKQKSILDIVGAPRDVFITNGELTSVNDSYYRYITVNGHCYHSNPNCSRTSMYKRFVYDVEKYSPCSRCAVRFTVPEWYRRYKELTQILSKMGIKN